MLPGKVTVPPQRVYPVRAFVTRPFRVLVHLYQADGLPAADDNGSSDAYCIVRVGSDRYTQTQVFPKTLTPSFLATCELDVQLPVYNVNQTTFEEPLGPITKPVKGKGGVGPSPLGPGAGGGGGGGKAGAAGALPSAPGTTPRGLERFAQTKSAMKSSSMDMDMRLPSLPEHTHITTVSEGETMPLLGEEMQTAAQIMEVAQIRQPAHPEGTQVRLSPSVPSLSCVLKAPQKRASLSFSKVITCDSGPRGCGPPIVKVVTRAAPARSHLALSRLAQENPAVASPSWIRGRDMGFFDADDMSSVAGGSEISSTLSYMGDNPGMRRYHAFPHPAEI